MIIPTTYNNSRVFVISDTHFGDDGIIVFFSRPFFDADEMDEELIRRWNETVNPDDIVYHLGDFAALNNDAEYLPQLNGHKMLVKGNHDTETNDYYRKCGFEEVYDHPIIVDEFYILSHKPMQMAPDMFYANIFGHVHANPHYADVSTNGCCVSAERTGYAPVLFEDVKNSIKNCWSQENAKRKVLGNQ